MLLIKRRVTNQLNDRSAPSTETSSMSTVHRSPGSLLRFPFGSDGSWKGSCNWNHPIPFSFTNVFLSGCSQSLPTTPSICHQHTGIVNLVYKSNGRGALPGQLRSFPEELWRSLELKSTRILTTHLNYYCIAPELNLLQIYLRIIFTAHISSN